MMLQSEVTCLMQLGGRKVIYYHDGIHGCRCMIWPYSRWGIVNDMARYEVVAAKSLYMVIIWMGGDGR